jgi:hypothetical protein
MSRSTARVTRLVLAAAFVLAGRGAEAQTYNIVYVENGFATCSTPPSGHYCGEKDYPWHGTGGDQTGGIVPAIKSCLSINSAQYAACTVILPRGYVDVSETIDTSSVNGSPANRERWGLVLRGHGSGAESTSSDTVYAGTVLRWQGDDNGTVLKVRSTRSSRFENFMIDGQSNGGNAGIGIHVGGDTSIAPASHDTFSNIAIEEVLGSPGIGILVASYCGGTTPCDYQVSETTFEDVVISEVYTGIRQEGEQTTNMNYNRVEIRFYNEWGIDVDDGDVKTNNARFLPWDPVGQSPMASLGDVRIGYKTNHVVFRDNYHESRPVDSSYHAYSFPPPPEGVSTSLRSMPTTFVNTLITWFPRSGSGSQTDRIIDYQQHGPVSFLGCAFDSYTANGGGVIHVESPAGAGATSITSLGNYYSVSGGIKLETAGYVSLIGDDNPTGEAAPNTQASTASMRYPIVNAGMVLEGSSSLQWKDSTGIFFKQYLNGDLLRFDNGTGTYGDHLLYLHRTSGDLKLEKPGGGIGFAGSGGATAWVVADNPSSSTLSRLPYNAADTDSTIVLDTMTQALTNKDLTSATNTFPSSLVTLTGTQTLSHKDLTATDNVYPQTAVLAFTNASTTASTMYGGPNTGRAGTTDGAVAIGVPRLHARSLRCKLANAPGSGKKWSFRLPGSASGSDCTGASLCCQAQNTTSCSATGDYLIADGTSLSLKFEATTSGNTSSIIDCTVGVGP